ncbi:hypothetical protein [Pendulispora albinea]|uniref:Uncharacterized protein n=1 Tax=Pendulispora albinea TaxID=2741071 RepID=A0ABZ2M4E9_9BACT
MVIFAVLAGASAGAGLMVGCGSDDSVVHPPFDGSIDGNKPDTGPVADAGPDARRDSGIRYDAGPPVFESYSRQITSLWCQKLQGCCALPQGFDLKRCEDVFNNSANVEGPALNRPLAKYLYDGGNPNIAFSATKARECFDAINDIGCGAQSAESFKRMYDICLGAAEGKLGANESGCAGSPECKRPNHCEKVGDASTGVCLGPRAEDAGCSPAADDYYEPQAECGYLITGDPRFCANLDTSAGAEVDGGRNVCTKQRPNGADCNAAAECVSGLCGSSLKCVAADNIGTEDVCKFYIPDAGDGG